MAVKYTNNAKSTLASGINSSVTSATVADGSIFPALGAGEYFYITFDDGSNNEIAKVTARSGNTLTIVRAQDNTTARAFSTGDSAELRIIAAVLTEIQENIAAKSANQTVYSATAASNATAYNIGVDPGVEANASVFLDGVYQHHDTFSFSGSTLTFDAAPTNGTKIEVVVDNLINLQSSNLTVDTFTATSGQTAFTLSDAPGGEANVLAFIDGVFQNQAAFTLSSNTLTFDTGVVVGRSVTVYTINPVNIGTPSDSTVTSAKLTGNITLPGSLTVGAYDVAFDSPTFFVDHTNSRVGLGTSSPSVPVDIVGETKMSSHLNLPDNAKIRVGTGTDLQLYHDGTHSYIDNNKGALFIRNNVDDDDNNNIILQAKSGEYSIICDDDGAVTLYYDNAAKLATASGGVTVTGDITGVTDLYIDDQILSTGDTDTYMQFHQADGWRVVTAGAERMNVIGAAVTINDDSHDADFRVESNANSHMLFVDGGNNRVGINQNSPQALLDIKGDTTTYAGMSKIYLTDTSSNSERRNWAIGNGGSGYGHFSVGVSNAADGDPMASGTHTTPFVIDHEGRVSIGGYANPGNFYAGASQLVVGKGVGDQGITIYAGDDSLGRIHFADGTSGNAEYAGFIAYNHSSNVLQIGAGADGGTDIVLNNNAVGIGTSTTVPASGAKLEIKGTYASTAPATSGTTDSMTLRLSQTAGNGVLDTGWGDQGSNPHFWLQSRNSGALNTNYAIGLNPNGGNVFIGQKFTNKGALTISEAGNTAGAAIDGVQLYKGLTNASNFLAWQQGNMGWRLGIRHNDGAYPLTLYMNSGSTPTAASPGDEILRFGTDQNMALNNTTTGWSAWSANSSSHFTVGNGGNSPTTSNYGVLNLLGSQGGSTHFSIGVGNGTMYAAYDYGNGAHRLTINSSGNFTGSASNDISDQRLKENIVTIPNALDKVKALKGRTFTWKASSKQATGTKYGFIAQEVESVASDLVYKDSGLCKIDSDDNPIHDIINYEGDAEYAKSVQTSGIIPILVEAMKEQQTIIEDLKLRIEALEG